VVETCYRNATDTIVVLTSILLFKEHSGLIKEAGPVLCTPIRHYIADSHVVTSWSFESHLKLSIWSEMYIRYVCVMHCCRHYCTYLLKMIKTLLQDAASKFRFKS